MRIQVLLLAASVLLSGSSLRAADGEEAAVRATVEKYFQGHATGDGKYFAEIFHPASSLFTIREGKFLEIPSADYIARAPGKPAADEEKRKRSIEFIDVTGNAAVAKVRLEYPAAVLTDYLSLLKIDGQWKIVNKIFHADPQKK